MTLSHWIVLHCGRSFLSPRLFYNAQAPPTTRFIMPVLVQIPGYDPEQLAPDWRSTLQEVWDHSAAVQGTVKHVCVRR